LIRNDFRHKTVFCRHCGNAKRRPGLAISGWGFVEIWWRNDYYDNPAKTAIVMHMK